MPIDEYTISSLTQSSGITNTDLMELATPDTSSETGYSSVSATVVQLASYMLKNILFESDLNTTDKTIIGAINEILAGGGGSASILYGTTAPTAQQGSNGNLYVQYTAGTGGADDTVDALYVKLDGSWCEIETGGGGSGGHTIVDDSGTALTQRTNLQFNGAYSEDNSTDDTTEVNVVREMTKAEFDLLSDDEKVGLINITDITGGNDDRFQPVIYSEEEREIGVWTDGKPLYEKTFVFTSTLTCATNDWTNTNISSSDIERIVTAKCYSNSGTLFDFIGANRDSSNYIQIFNARSSSITVDILVLQYTKTTDTAGSGQWTPQGVPSHHYSTDEQVVGTWIDGSTVYEKTFFLSQRTSITNDYTTYIIDDITVYDIDNIISCEIFDNNSDSAPLTKIAYLERAVDAIISSDKLIAYYPTNNACKMTGFILRYTKSST